ncbi:MAG: hypothetical protein K2N93_04700, partial [Alistipes sp.]|nr:hypothetical protein [Alistipes sp.]
MVKVLMFIIVALSLSFVPTCRKMPATPGRGDKLAGAARRFVTPCRALSRHACHRATKWPRVSFAFAPDFSYLRPIMSEFIVSARKYRPATFRSVVG